MDTFLTGKWLSVPHLIVEWGRFYPLISLKQLTAWPRD